MNLAELYRDVLETSPDGIWVVDLDGRTLYANPALARMYGADLSGLTVFDTLDATGRGQFQAHLDDLRAGRINLEEVEVKFVRRDGSHLWVMVRESVLRDADGHLAAVVHRISLDGRREMLQELRESRARLAEAQRIARLGSWSYDSDTDTVVSSPELLALYGLPPEENTHDAATFLAMIHPDDRQAVDAAFRRALAGDDPELTFLARIRSGSGWVWTRGRAVARRDEDGRVLVSGTHQDVTETQEAYAALEDLVNQSVLLQAIASAANEAGTLLDVLRRARPLVLNHERWTRGRVFLPDPEGEGLAPLPLYPGERAPDEAERSAAEQALAQEAARRRAPAWSDDGLTIGFCVLLEDEVRAVLTVTAGAPVQNPERIEQIVGRIAVQLARVAEREKAQADLAETRDQAMEASRQKSEFLATMSHEIRTPLNGVIGLNDLLLRTDLDAEQQRLASGVQVASRALLGVLNDVLDFSKIEAGRLELEVLDFGVRALLDQVISVLAENARAKGLDLSVSCAPDVPEVLAGDPTRIAQVLNNLVSNAVKFTEQGRVEVRATAAPCGPEDDCGPGACAEDDVVLRVDVTDTGVGIDEADVDALFAPFTQADASTTRVYGGTGLGLAIAREIVEALGGRLEYAPRPGGGSIFTFTAVLGRAAGTVIERQDAQAREVLGGRRVLVVDDVAENRAVLAEQLAWWGLEVDEATGADAALARLADAAQDETRYDALLVDLAMPGQDGLDLVAAVRERPQVADTPVLVLSSTLGPLPDRARDLEVAEHLSKPVLTSALRASLLRQLAGEKDEPEESLSEPEEAPLPAPYRVLVVEDNPVNQMVATGLLESLGYQAQTADDGLIALDVLGTERFDAILMDVQMPRMDGYSTTRELRSREEPGSRVPVIAMTAAALEGERERCLEAGMDDFLTKPVDPRALAEVLERWLTHRSAGPVSGDQNPDPQEDAVTAPVDGLDLDRLEMLRELDPSSTAYLDRAIGNFDANAAGALATIRDAIAAEDVAALRAAAHKLAGSALNLGVTEAGRAARALEHLADSGSTEDDGTLVAALEEALTQGRAALRAYQADYQAARG